MKKVICLICFFFSISVFAGIDSRCKIEKKELSKLTSDFSGKVKLHYNAKKVILSEQYSSKLLADGCVYIFSLEIVGGDYIQVWDAEIYENGEVRHTGTPMDSDDLSDAYNF